MKKIYKSSLIIAFVTLTLTACTEEQQNRISRLGVTVFEGNYRVTFAEGNHLKTWIVRDSKVTSEPEKGYYYFWTKVDGKDLYVQTPVARTYLEEIP